jgi:hypothetical protein
MRRIAGRHHAQKIASVGRSRRTEDRLQHRQEPRLRAQRREGGMGQHHAEKLDPAGIVVGA